MKWQKIIVFINALTLFLTCVFLLMMMLFKNAVPLTNDILMSTSYSITYFVMSIITLFFLYFCHEVASSMYLKWQGNLFIAFYGISILGIGAGCMAEDATAMANERWGKMSINQKDFFGNKMDDLATLRAQNHSDAGIFFIVIGAMILLEAIFLEFMLRKKRAGLDDKQFGKALMKTSGAQTRNIPKRIHHEQCEFPYIANFKATADKYRK